jgi:lysophospholipase L1-like esterase
MHHRLRALAAALAAAAALDRAEAKVYPPDDPNLHYSPFAWQVTAKAASTINSASYVRFLASGSAVSFKFDVSQMVSPISEVYWSVDQGPKTLSLVLDTVTVTIPPNNTATTVPPTTRVFVPYHTVELFVKSTTERANRWKAEGPSTRVILTGIECDGLLAPWLPQDVNILVYGDSITEGVLALGASQKFDTDHNDGSVVYSYRLGGLLGAEIGVIGFGYNALTHAGSGAVAPLPTAWNQLWEGVPRSFTAPKPDLIVLNEGTNDGCDTTKPGCVGADITKPMASVLKNLTVACPGVPIAVMQPFNGGQTAHLQAAIKLAGSGDIKFVSTEGFCEIGSDLSFAFCLRSVCLCVCVVTILLTMHVGLWPCGYVSARPRPDNISLGGSLHPTGMNDVAQIAPKLANVLRPMLTKGLVARYERDGLLN